MRIVCPLFLTHSRRNNLGFELAVESGAGEISHYSDNEYQTAGSQFPTKPQSLSLT